MRPGYPTLRDIDAAIVAQSPGLERGAKAKALLENELLQDAFNQTEGAILHEFERIALMGSGGDQAADYQRVGAELKAMAKFRSNIKSLVNDGKVAQTEVNRLEGERVVVLDQEAMVG